ncbi:MAG: hypothetical protein ACQGVC_17320 [Myxococcota bacterium]
MLRRFTPLLAALPLAGCLVPIPEVSLEAPGAAGAGLPDSLGVVEFSDRRPREQRRGKTPWLIPLIVWNQRMGRYVTGSKHFGGDVPRTVSAAVADALSGWRFGRGRVIEAADDAGVADYCADETLSYVATGEIHHLYGAVRQRAWLFIIPTPWVQGMFSGNDVGDPVGVARLSLRVHDCRSGDQVVSERFVSEGLFPRLSPSAAAQRAFDDLIRDMARLSRTPMSEQLAEPLPDDDEPSLPRIPSARHRSEPEPEPEPEVDPEPEEESEPVLTPL